MLTPPTPMPQTQRSTAYEATPGAAALSSVAAEDSFNATTHEVTNQSAPFEGINSWTSDAALEGAVRASQ